MIRLVNLKAVLLVVWSCLRLQNPIQFLMYFLLDFLLVLKHRSCIFSVELLRLVSYCGSLYKHLSNCNLLQFLNRCSSVGIDAVSWCMCMVYFLQIAPFDPTKKKKKKKVVLQDPTDEIVDKLAEKTESLSGMKSWHSVPCFIIFSFCWW